MKKFIEYMGAGFEAIRSYAALRLVGYGREDAWVLVVRLKAEGIREEIERRVKNGR